MSTADRISSIGFTTARRLLALVGLLLIAVLTLVLWARSADDIEIIATLLYAPIVIALLFLGVPGGLAAGVFATIAYVVLRSDAVDVVGGDEFAGLIASRGIAYVLFGVAGGWAASTLEASLHKLARVDDVDDRTGLGNSRALHRTVDLERARAARYGTVFSVSVVTVPAATIQSVRRRRRGTLFRALGEQVAASVRTVDRVAHHFDGGDHRFAAVLPETNGAGAGVFHDRFAEQISDVLRGGGADETALGGRVCTVPGQEEELDALLAPWPAGDQ